MTPSPKPGLSKAGPHHRVPVDATTPTKPGPNDRPDEGKQHTPVEAIVLLTRPSGQPGVNKGRHHVLPCMGDQKGVLSVGKRVRQRRLRRLAGATFMKPCGQFWRLFTSWRRRSDSAYDGCGSRQATRNHRSYDRHSLSYHIHNLMISAPAAQIRSTRRLPASGT